MPVSAFRISTSRGLAVPRANRTPPPAKPVAAPETGEEGGENRWFEMSAALPASALLGNSWVESAMVALGKLALSLCHFATGLDNSAELAAHRAPPHVLARTFVRLAFANPGVSPNPAGDSCKLIKSLRTAHHWFPSRNTRSDGPPCAGQARPGTYPSYNPSSRTSLP